MSKPIKWAAEITHVREVSLFGTADLPFWQNQLAQEGLLPIERDGQAQLMIIAADAKFMGLRFCELSISVLAAHQKEGKRENAAYLVRAFNSSRFFAFCERVLFSTPYDYGQVGLSAALPSSVQLILKGKVAFRAVMQVEASGMNREPSRSGDDGWAGSIYLPRRTNHEGHQGKLFFARIQGKTKTYPFVPGRDALTISTSTDCEVLRALVHSHFIAKEWAIREDATHAKSRTYVRGEVLAGVPQVLATGKREY